MASDNDLHPVNRGRFPALQSRNFRLLAIGQGISAIGGMMQVWAINWHLYLLTHSPISLGMIGLFRVVPIVVFSLIGGTVADAWNRRQVLLVTQITLTVTTAVLTYVTFTNHISEVWIYGITLIGSAAMAFDNPARQSLIPNLVPRQDFANAIAINSIVFRTATIIGPVAAGLLIARGGLAYTYLINCLSFLATITALLMMRFTTEEREISELDRAKVSLEALREGLNFVFKTPILVWTLSIDFIATFFSTANSLMPIFARDILKAGARGYGLLAAAEAIGALIAGTVISAMRPISRQGRMILFAVTVYGISTVVFGFSRIFWLSWLALAMGGAADCLSTILRQTIRQLVTPDRLRGRMTSINMIFFMGGPQLGELEAGLVAAWIGASASVVTGGIACLLAIAFIAPRAVALRKYRTDKPLSTV